MQTLTVYELPAEDCLRDMARIPKKYGRLRVASTLRTQVGAKFFAISASDIHQWSKLRYSQGRRVGQGVEQFRLCDYLEREGEQIMPIAKELTIRIEDQPGTLAQCCRALADRDVNILAFEAFEREGQSLIRMVVDDSATAKELLAAERINYTETEVAQVALPHRSRDLYRAASRLGEAHINVNYAYCGTEPGANMSLVVFGVTDVAKTVSLLEKVAEAA